MVQSLSMFLQFHRSKLDTGLQRMWIGDTSGWLIVVGGFKKATQQEGQDKPCRMIDGYMRGQFLIGRWLENRSDEKSIGES